MNPYNTPSRQLLSDLNDVLAHFETVLHAATISQQTAIENAIETINGPNEGNHYTQLTNTIADLRDRIHTHLEN